MGTEVSNCWQLAAKLSQIQFREGKRKMAPGEIWTICHIILADSWLMGGARIWKCGSGETGKVKIPLRLDIFSSGGLYSDKIRCAETAEKKNTSIRFVVNDPFSRITVPFIRDVEDWDNMFFEV